MKPKTVRDFKTSKEFSTDVKYTGVRSRAKIHYHWRVSVVPVDSQRHARLSKTRVVYVEIITDFRLSDMGYTEVLNAYVGSHLRSYLTDKIFTRKIRVDRDHQLKLKLKLANV